MLDDRTRAGAQGEPMQQQPGEQSTQVPPPPKPADFWDCICGQHGNTGNFCVNCGQPKSASDVRLQQMRAVPPMQQAVPQRPQPAPRMQAPRQMAYQQASMPGQMPPANSGNNGLKAVIAVAIFAVACFLGYGVYKEFIAVPAKPTQYSSLAKNNDAAKQPAQQDKKDKQQATPDKPAAGNMQTDLSLGGLDLGNSMLQMHQVLGQENTTKNSTDTPGLVFYNYADVQVGIQNSEVTSLVSNGPSVQTKRGLHEGSTLQEVQAAYGTDYYSSQPYQNLMLYEYKFQTLNGENGLLRFAMNQSDNRVNYISVRVLRE